jgi:GDP-4-dehydro-6-deoxy-D-mannose reductase
MRILVIGSAGFAGGYLTRELSGAGHEVWGTTRQLRAPAAELPTVVCDVTLPETIAGSLRQVEPDAVVLLAGISSPPVANRDPTTAFKVHALGTVHLLTEVARLERSTRVLVVTSGEVYGATDEARLPVTEASDLSPTTLYAASKAAADLVALAQHASICADVVRLRPFNHTGPGQRPGFVCPDFARQVARIARGRQAPVIEVGNLDVVRDFSDVRDVVRGYAAALAHGRAGEAYNLCSGRGTTVRAVLETLCDLAGIAPEIRVVTSRQRRSEVRALWGSPRKAEAELGWRPEIPLRRTLQDLLQSCLAVEA